jgi:protein-S-isoprenylcysteine O-methyltransferase Ste14
MNASRRSRIFVALRACLFGCVIVVFWVWLILLARRFDPYFAISLPPWLRPLGVVLLVGGALLALACVVLFATKGRGTPAPFDPPRKFVAEGPYRFVRNPMYVGEIAAVAGAGFALASPSILFIAFVAFLALHLFVVFYEEPALGRRFGQSYQEYKASVPRWLIHRPRRQAY